MMSKPLCFLWKDWSQLNSICVKYERLFTADLQIDTDISSIFKQIHMCALKSFHITVNRPFLWLMHSRQRGSEHYNPLHWLRMWMNCDSFQFSQIVLVTSNNFIWN